MDLKHDILNYLIKNKKAYSINELANIFDVDSFFMKQNLIEMESNLQVKCKKNKYVIADYKLGEIVVTRKGNVYIEYNGSKVWISANRLNNAQSGDMVLVDIINTKGNNLDGTVISIKERKNKNKVGTIINIGEDMYIKPDSKKDSSLIRVPNNNILGEKVIYSKGKLIRDNIYKGAVLKTIGHIDDPKMDVYSKLAAFNVEQEFSDEANEQLKTLPNEVSDADLEGRKDLRKEKIFTIDGDDSKDLDDAVSLKMLDNGNYLLGVHIADVSHYVPVSSPIDLDAHKRGTSVYPPGTVIPMLSHTLSSGICSLFEGVDRLTLSCIMEITKTGQVVNYEVTPSVIHSSKRMTYNNVNKVLNNDTPLEYDNFKEELIEMDKLAKVLNHNRLNKGSIEFSSDEVKVIVDEQGKPIDISKRVRGEGEKLIEEFMLIANTTVSSYLTEKEYPSLYRVHNIPNMDKVRQLIRIMNANSITVGKPSDDDTETIKKVLLSLENNPNKDIYSDLLLRSMAKAVYSTENIGHFGLGFKDYTHFTSPIRRYPDLTIHRLIKEYNNSKLDEATIREKENYLIEVGHQSSLKERNADACESAITRMKMAEYINNSNVCDYNVRITSLGKYGINVELANGIKGMVTYTTMSNPVINETAMFVKTPYRIYRLGDVLDVTLDAIDVSSGQINFKEKVLVK